MKIVVLGPEAEDGPVFFRLLGTPQLFSHHDGGTYQLSVKRVQGEPERHSAPLAFGNRLHPMGVLTTRREADHSPALGLDGGLWENSQHLGGEEQHSCMHWPHLSLS